jgi:hypothetical protein
MSGILYHVMIQKGLVRMCIKFLILFSAIGFPIEQALHLKLFALHLRLAYDFQQYSGFELLKEILCDLQTCCCSYSYLQL